MACAYYPKIVLPVRRNLQDTSYDCGPASLKIILETLGVHVDEERLMKMGKTTPEEGTPPDKLIAILKEFGVKHEVIDHANLELIEQKIREINLLLVDYQSWGDGGSDYKGLNTGHYSVVFGFNKTHLWIADPAKHKTQDYKKWGARKMRKDMFLERWQDREEGGTKTYRWMIAVPLCQKNFLKKDK